MKDKKISIIIPHYNSFEQLKKLISSIGIREEMQIIVVDDNSTENADKIPKFAKQAGVEFYRNDSDTHSAGRCRNIGLEHATGEWLLFADADDYFLENYWEHISKYFDSEYDVIFFPPTSIDIRTGEKSNRHNTLEKLAVEYMKNPSKENEVYLRYLWASPISKLIRRDIVEAGNILFDETRVANDVMFSAKVAYAAKRIISDPGIIYCITKNSGTLEMSQARDDVRMRLRVNVNKYRFLTRNLDKESMKILDFRISYYMCIIRRKKGTRRDYIWAWLYCLSHGVRLFSRRVTIKNVFSKIMKKVFKKNG